MVFPAPQSDSEHTLDVGLGEIAADIEQGALGTVGELVGEAVPEIERGGMKAPAPPGIGVRHAARRRRAEGDDFEAGDQGFHLGSRAAAVGDDQGFRDRRRRYQDRVVRGQGVDAIRGFRLVEQDRHQGGRVDGDHLGRPRSS